eukprot:s1683_g22.t1
MLSLIQAGLAWLAAYWLCATVSVPCHILLSPAMEAGFLDRKLDPKRFQEYCLSREVAQDPTELWSSEDGTAAAGADEFSPSNRLLPISTRGVDVHLLAVRATGCVHIKDGTNFCVSQCDKASQEPTRSAVLAHGQPFVSHDASSWLAIFSRTSLELVPLDESGLGDQGFRMTLAPEMEGLGGSLGDALAVELIPAPGGATQALVLFCEVHQGLGPRPHYRLTFMKLVASGNGAVASSEKLLELSGLAPPLAASISGHCCIIVANGIYAVLRLTACQ